MYKRGKIQLRSLVAAVVLGIALFVGIKYGYAVAPREGVLEKVRDAEDFWFAIALYAFLFFFALLFTFFRFYETDEIEKEMQEKERNKRFSERLDPFSNREGWIDPADRVKYAHEKPEDDAPDTK